MVIADITVNKVYARAVRHMPIPAGIVGAQVRILYEDPFWEGLSKTVVFSGAVTKDVVTNADMITIPAEVLAKPGVALRVGVYGVDSAGCIAIPTVWAELGRTRDAADPSGDTSTDPALPVWSQIMAMIGNLNDLDTKAKENLVAAVNEALTKGGGAVDEAEIQRIVDEYLAANPPTVTETDPTVPAWAKQPQKPTYTAEEVGALSAGTLPDAINTALAQAKDSGEFDGKDGNPGTPGADGYSPTANVTQTDTGAVITITDKTGTTTAALKNGADGQPGAPGATPNIQIGTVETLEAGSHATASIDGTPENPILHLGIPQGAPGSGGGSGIAVTGATVGQTVKIAAVDDDGVPTAWEPVDFPSGGIGKEWRLINRFTIETDDLAKIYFNTDLDGNPFELSEVWIVGDGRNATTHSGSSSVSIFFRFGDGSAGDAAQYIYPIRLNSSAANYQRGFMAFAEIITETAAIGFAGALVNSLSSNIGTFMITESDFGACDAVREIAIFPGVGTVLYGVGTIVSVWGR